MLYMFLITYNPAIEQDPSMTNLQPKHAAYEAELRAEGLYHGGAALTPPPYAATIRVDHGTVTKLDGPFAETKELLGGYFVIDCKDEAEAIARAEKIPTDNRSWIDIRPIFLWHPR